MWWWVRQSLGAPHCLLVSHRGRCLVPSSFQPSPPQLGHIISSMGIQYQQYADDTQLFISLTSSDQYKSVACLERYLWRLHEWFCTNGLALNPDKSEAIWLNTHQGSRTLPPHKSVDVAGTRVLTTQNFGSDLG